MLAEMDFDQLEAKAGAVALMLKTMGNTKRLMLLCKLAEHGELSVGDLAHEVALSQSACSQHLAKLREEGLIEFRREGQTLFYRIADPRAETLMGTLYELYCKD